MAIGRKAQQYMKRRPKFNVVKEFNLGKAPTMQDSQAISDNLFASFVSEECDKVEMIYTKFVSLITSDPTVQVGGRGEGQHNLFYSESVTLPCRPCFL